MGRRFIDGELESIVSRELDDEDELSYASAVSGHNIACSFSLYLFQMGCSVRLGIAPLTSSTGRSESRPSRATRLLAAEAPLDAAAGLAELMPIICRMVNRAYQ